AGAHLLRQRGRRQLPQIAHGFTFSTIGGTRKNPSSPSGAAASACSGFRRRPSGSSARSSASAGANTGGSQPRRCRRGVGGGKSSPWESWPASRSIWSSGISSRASSAMRFTSARSIDMAALAEEARQHLLDAGAEAHRVAQRVALPFGRHHHSAAEALVIDLAPDGGRARGRSCASPRVARRAGVPLARSSLLAAWFPRCRILVGGDVGGDRLLALQQLRRNLVHET